MAITNVTAPVFVQVKKPTSGDHKGEKLLVNAGNIEYINPGKKNGSGVEMQYTYHDEFGGTRKQDAIIKPGEIQKLGLDVTV